MSIGIGADGHWLRAVAAAAAAEAVTSSRVVIATG